MSKVLVFKKNGTIEVRNKSNLTATPSEAPSAGVGSPVGGSVSSSPKRTRRSFGRRKIQAVARDLMNREPGRFKTLEVAMAFATRNNVNKAADIYGEYCVGPDSHLTEEEYIEKHERPTATQLILKGVEAAPGATFTERLEKVLRVWPGLGERWLRER